MKDKPKKNGGARPGAGRKPKVSEDELVSFLRRAWNVKDRREVINAMIAEAKAGNVKAATLLMAYAYGKPKEHITHAGQIDSAISVIEVVKPD